MSEMGIAAPYSLEQIVAYEPERSFNYELGFHSTTAGGELGIDGVLFYIDCRNQQMTTFPAGTVTGRVMTNAGRTRSFGANCRCDGTPPKISVSKQATAMPTPHSANTTTAATTTAANEFLTLRRTQFSQWPTGASRGSVPWHCA